MSKYNYHKDGTQPSEEQIFVFGSNLSGIHGAGAARKALDSYKAEIGRGFGMTGRCFAIPTKDWVINSMTLNEVEVFIRQFVKYAKIHTELEFFCTSVGTGLAGFSVESIAPLFYPPLPNVSYPDTWQPIFEACDLDAK